MRPSFPLLLSYEFHIRTEAFRLVREKGSTLKEALKAARMDPETRMLKFATPLSIEAQKRKSDQTSLWRQEPPLKFQKGGSKGSKGSGKDNNQGKGKGKGKKGKTWRCWG